MPPYFETVKSFADVEVPELCTEDFLQASDGLVKMFDLLDSTVFGFIQTDIKNNLAAVQRRHEAFKEDTFTIETLVRHEQASVSGHKEATACVVRVIRGLYLICIALQNLQKDQEAEPHACFKRAYDIVLKHHHSFIIRSAVSVAIRAAPRRNDFYTRIAQGSSKDDLDAALRKWLDGLEVIVVYMKDWLQETGYGTV